MYKDASYKEKFLDVKQWAPIIIESIKKEIKNDHLKKDLYFVKKYLPTKNIQKITTDELSEAYLRAIESEENANDIAEFLISCWLMRNAELYTLFEDQLSQITADFSELEELTSEQANQLVNESNQQFGAFNTYIFSVFNSVVFPKEIFESLKKQAATTHQAQIEEKSAQKKQLDLEALLKNHEIEIARLSDKHEKKLQGLQKKYQMDQEALKKQIATLQRKLQETSVR